MMVMKGGRVVLYQRVSTALQAADGHGLDAQRTRLDAFAAERGMEVVEVIADEGQSGKDLKRPGMLRVIELAERGLIDGLVVTKTDRVSRSLRDLLNLIELLRKQDVALVTTDEAFDTTTPMGKAMQAVSAAFGELERDMAAVRTREALEEARRKGIRLGRPPLGWTKEGGELVQSDRFEVVERAFALHRRDGMTLASIADLFNDEGVPTGSGRGRWAKGNVARLVQARYLAVDWCPVPEWATA